MPLLKKDFQNFKRDGLIAKGMEFARKSTNASIVEVNGDANVII